MMNRAQRRSLTSGGRLPTRHQIAAEAVCSALWNLDFKAIGETEGGRVSWFTRGVHPKNIRVRVERSLVSDHINVVAEWRNFSNNARLKGEQTWTIDCGANVPPAEIPLQVQEVTVQVLEIFRQVLEGTGVAGTIEKLVDAPEENE